MSFLTDPFVVILDANVLYPFRTRDVLLTFAKEGLFRAHLTNDILGELSSSLLRRKPHLEASVKSQELAIRTTLEGNFVTGYRALIAGLELPDPDDRHVLAAAIKCSAQHIVTENHKDFPPKRFGIMTSRRSARMNSSPIPSNCTRTPRSAHSRLYAPATRTRPSRPRNFCST